MCRVILVVLFIELSFWWVGSRRAWSWVVKIIAARVNA